MIIIVIINTHTWHFYRGQRLIRFFRLPTPPRTRPPVGLYPSNEQKRETRLVNQSRLLYR